MIIFASGALLWKFILKGKKCRSLLQLLSEAMNGDLKWSGLMVF